MISLLLSKCFPPRPMRVDHHRQRVSDSRISVNYIIPESGIGRPKIKKYRDAVDRFNKTGRV